jgi:hypothetical protein
MLRTFVIIPLFFVSYMNAQTKTDAYLATILAQNQDPVFQQVLNDPGKYRLQIIYTEINRDKNNKQSFTNYYFHYDPQLYFNPASVVKLPLAILSLEKLHALRKKGIDKNTSLLFDSSSQWQTALEKDPSSPNGLPSVAQFIKRALLVSENDPYNRMYQFLGQGHINNQLKKKGLNDSRIARQFLGLNEEQNRHTNAFRFVDTDGKIIHQQPAVYNDRALDFSTAVLLGKGYLDRYDRLINEPFDFTKHNWISLGDMTQMLQRVMFPKSVPKQQRFDLSKDDLEFLYRYLSQYPSETPYPKYDAEKYYDSYVKFFFRDSSKKMPNGVRVFNKVGWSYGFLTDVSFVADFENNTEYMLAATLYVNSDEILNDNKYEYDQIGHPFLFQLGKTIYDFESRRERKFKPDLSAFRIQYECRSSEDQRSELSEVDN